MRMLRRAILISALASFAAVVVVGASWPIAPQTTQLWGPEARSDGVSWCGRDYNGSYGNVYFAQAQVYVSYGGTCNAAWGQPQNWIAVNAEVQDSGHTVIASSGYFYNGQNSNWAQATVPQLSNAFLYGANLWFWDGSINFWRNPVSGLWRNA